MLKKLIYSILENNMDNSIINRSDIIIVDNDVEMSAKSTISEINYGREWDNKLMYFNHPIKGLSNVRNKLLRKAFLLAPDFVIFVDDDEYVTTNWLNELVRTIIKNNGDMVMGPVVSVCDNNIPDFISCWFKRPNHYNNSKLKYIRTGNLIINVKSLVRNNIWFDNRFNKTGSEDLYFGFQMLKKGARIFWAANAIVYENIPAERAKLNWLIIRAYRWASTATYVLKMEKEYLLILKTIILSLAYIIAGICATFIIIMPIKKKYWGLLKIAKGTGGLAGLFRILYNEYE